MEGVINMKKSIDSILNDIQNLPDVDRDYLLDCLKQKYKQKYKMITIMKASEMIRTIKYVEKHYHGISQMYYNNVVFRIMIDII